MMNKVKLIPIDADNWEEVCDLEVSSEQEGFVAPNWYSIIESTFMDECYPMAIVGDNDSIVGFLMYDWDNSFADKVGDRRLMMSRLMIAEDEQRKGYGGAAILLLIEKLHTDYPNTAIYTSIEPNNENMIRLCEKLGFVKTGEIAWDEIVFVLEPQA